jgi:hypothetical protein
MSRETFFALLKYSYPELERGRSMAHDRKGPDIVMTARYVGLREIHAVTEHEVNRDSDGTSAIDPSRSHLNEILHGPSTQTEAIEEMLKAGVKSPAKQSDTPFIQIVYSASPDYFRDEGEGAGTWNQEKLDAVQASSATTMCLTQSSST